MKKAWKITIIVSSSVVVLLGAGALGAYFYVRNVLLNPPTDVESVPPLEEKADKMYQEVFESIPYEVSQDIQFKYEFEGYEEYKVEYFSRDESIVTNRGKVTRRDYDQYLSIDLVISTIGFSKTYDRPIKVMALEGTVILDNVYYEVMNFVPKRPEDGFVLPTKSKTLEEAKITWTGIDDPTNTIRLENENTIRFVGTTEKEEKCRLLFDVSYKGMKQSYALIIFTKVA